MNCVENCDGYVAERGEKKKDKKDKNSKSENQITTDVVLELNNLMYLFFFTLLSPPAFFPSYNNIRTC